MSRATWKSPKTWYSGERITPQMLNEQLRDNFRALEARVADLEAGGYTCHGDSFDGGHSDCIWFERSASAPAPHSVPPIVPAGIALTVAAGVAAATEIKKPISRRGLFTFGWLRGEDDK